jgi:hypothetical protein
MDDISFDASEMLDLVYGQDDVDEEDKDYQREQRRQERQLRQRYGDLPRKKKNKKKAA